MRRTLFIVLLAGAVAVPVQAQDAPAGEMGQVVTVQPHPGQAADFEAHAGAYVQWAVGAGATWPWAAFQVIGGERTGQYLFGTFSHAASDWDTPDVDPAAALEAQRQHLAPYTQHYRTEFVRFRTDLSTGQPGGALRPLYLVTTYDVALGQDEAFVELLKAAKSAFMGGDEPAEYFVYQTLVGQAGRWVISVPLENWAAMEPGPDDAFQQLMTATYGRYHADEMMAVFGEAITSAHTELLALRTDLSMNLPPMN